MPGVDDSFDDMMPGDIEAARAAVAAAGYDGTPVVILHPADHANIAPLGLITASLLEKIGFNVQLETMDWGTLTHRRQSKALVDSGGWNIFHTYWSSASIATPPENSNIRGNGEEGGTDGTMTDHRSRGRSMALGRGSFRTGRHFQEYPENGDGRCPGGPSWDLLREQHLRQKAVRHHSRLCSYFWNVV